MKYAKVDADISSRKSFSVKSSVTSIPYRAFTNAHKAHLFRTGCLPRRGILQDKMLFGSDWLVITPDRWLSDFAKLDIREEIRPKALKANAQVARDLMQPTFGRGSASATSPSIQNGTRLKDPPLYSFSYRCRHASTRASGAR